MVGTENAMRRGRWCQWTSATVILALALLGTMGCDRDRAVAVRKLNEGLKAYEQGQTVAAVEKMKEAAQTDGDFAKPHYQAAQLYEMDLNEPEKAEQHYRDALDIDGENADYAYGLGRVLADQDKYEESIDAFKKVVDIDENHAKAWFRLGRAQRAIGEHAAAVESFMKSIEANPRMRMGEEDPGGAHYHALADLYVEFGFYDKALAVYENGVENNSESPRLFQGRGVAQLELERFEDAAASFEKALELDSTRSTALFNLAVAHQKMGRPKGAMDALEKFLEMAKRADNQARIAAAQGMMQELEKQMEEGSKSDKER